MPFKYRQRRYKNMLQVWLQRLLTPRNVTTTVVVSIIFGVIAPVFLVNFFGSIYAEAELNPHIQKCITTAFEQTENRKVLLTQLAGLRCKKLYVYGKDYDRTRDFVKYLDQRLVDVEVVPDFSASNALEFCQNLLDQGVDQAISLSNKVKNIQLAYACELHQIDLVTVNMVDPTFMQQVASGFELAQLIVLVNTTAQ